MNAELAEIRDFIARHVPFSVLDGPSIDTLPRLFSVRYLRRGSAFPPPQEHTPCLYLLRTGAVERRDADGVLIETLCEGDVFAAPCSEEKDNLLSHSTAIEDTLVYLLPCDKLRDLRRQHPVLDEHLVRSTAEQLRHGRRMLRGHPSAADGDAASPSRLMTLSVRDFVRRAPVSGPPTMTIRQAAQRMSEHKVSALLIVETANAAEQSVLCGIVTDRDLRSRCLAPGLSPESPVSAIMSHEVHRIGPESAAFEALMMMTQKGIHHLPVADATGLVGLVSSSDLMRWQSANAAYLAGIVRKAESLSDLVHASAELPELQMRMQHSGATPRQLGLAVSSINDTLTARLIELAQADLGKAPVAFAWMACGSQGRHEQTVHSDQDNALIFSNDYDAAQQGDYFAALARRVNDGLDACGFRYCPGKIMASNADWAQSQQRWIEMFETWISRSDTMAAMLAANFLDMRTVYGDASLLGPVHHAIQSAHAGHGEFLPRLLSNALSNKPPLGLFRHLTLIADGEHADTLDIKHRGLIPITDLARLHALVCGIGEVGTVARLQSGGTQLLSQGAAQELIEVFEYLGSLRLRHQARQIMRGLAADNYLAPGEFTSLERSNLTQGFRVIATVQKALAQRFADRLPE